MPKKKNRKREKNKTKERKINHKERNIILIDGWKDVKRELMELGRIMPKKEYKKKLKERSRILKNRRMSKRKK